MHDPGGGDYGEGHYDDTSGSGLLGATLRNVVILVGLCLGVAWMMSGVDSLGPGPSVAGGPADEARGGVTAPDAPTQKAAYEAAELIVPAGPRGHFVVDIEVNGSPVRFLVDTGATTVTLTARDAERIGLPVRALDYSARFQTANGEIEAAPVILRDMTLGGLDIRDVEATVTQAPLNISLLGMSFLKRLSGYEVRPEGLILRF